MQQFERAKRVRRWWTTKADGNVKLTICYGSKSLELAKSKNAVELASESELFGSLERIHTALEQGELDELNEAPAAGRNRINTISPSSKLLSCEPFSLLIFGVLKLQNFFVQISSVCISTN